MSVVAAAFAAAMVLAGCGSNPPGVDPAMLGLPLTPAPPALAATTIATSPDGGIYKNPDHLEVVMVSRHAVAPIERQLGPGAAGWAALHRFGDFTLVALRIRDDGKVGSDPRLDTLQMASDYAPAGTSSGPLRHFYHPTYPLALLSTVSPGEGCSVHLDPGATVIAILVYPPVNLSREMVWGAFGDFVLTVPAGGAVPSPTGTLHPAACSAPSAATPRT